MARKGIVFENENSKRRVTVQLRAYDSTGVYVGKSLDESSSIQVKNATELEVREVIEKALEEHFGPRKNS